MTDAQLIKRFVAGDCREGDRSPDLKYDARTGNFPGIRKINDEYNWAIFGPVHDGYYNIAMGRDEYRTVLNRLGTIEESRLYVNGSITAPRRRPGTRRRARRATPVVSSLELTRENDGI